MMALTREEIDALLFDGNAAEKPKEGGGEEPMEKGKETDKAYRLSCRWGRFLNDALGDPGLMERCFGSDAQSVHQVLGLLEGKDLREFDDNFRGHLEDKGMSWVFSDEFQLTPSPAILWYIWMVYCGKEPQPESGAFAKERAEALFNERVERELEQANEERLKGSAVRWAGHLSGLLESPERMFRVFGEAAEEARIHIQGRVLGHAASEILRELRAMHWAWLLNFDQPSDEMLHVAHAIGDSQVASPEELSQLMEAFPLFDPPADEFQPEDEPDQIPPLPREGLDDVVRLPLMEPELDELAATPVVSSTPPEADDGLPGVIFPEREESTPADPMAVFGGQLEEIRAGLGHVTGLLEGISAKGNGPQWVRSTLADIQRALHDLGATLQEKHAEVEGSFKKALDSLESIAERLGSTQSDFKVHRTEFLGVLKEVVDRLNQVLANAGEESIRFFTTETAPSKKNVESLIPKMYQPALIVGGFVLAGILIGLLLF